MPDCKYFEVCQSDGRYKREEDWLCVLHLPTTGKNPDEFNRALQTILNAQRTDFRHIVFPAGKSFDGKGKTFTTSLNLDDVVLDHILDLAGATLHEGLSLKTHNIAFINLAGATIDGPVNLQIYGAIDTVSGEDASFTGPFKLSAKKCQRFHFGGAKSRSSFHVEIDDSISGVFLSASEIDGGIHIVARSIDGRGVELNSALVVNGDISIKTESTLGKVDANSATFRKNVTIESPESGTLNFTDAQVDGSLTIRMKRAAFSCFRAKLGLGIDAQGSHLQFNAQDSGQEAFAQVEFTETSTLNFKDGKLEGDLIIAGTPTPPKLINLSNCIITGTTSIRSELGKPFIDVTALEKAPEFRGDVAFTNVSLKNCRLLGNSIEKFRLSNITWDRPEGYSALYDERVLDHEKELIPNLREAYQILKEKYRQQGDHLTSGDFHYGEMEMSRRGSGTLSRNFGLGAWYSYLSAYGTSPSLAFFWLVLMVTVFSLLFAILQDDIFEGFLLSLQAATFQPTPTDKSISVRFLFALERLLVPLQGALLVLAVRMRLKR